MYQNDGEIRTLIQIVKVYYRYKNFCIVTPYDGQRAAIQRALENEDLPSDSVYNLDSFQAVYRASNPSSLLLTEFNVLGNEADYILISVVRSEKPGYLVSENRMNVFLTRCKKAMIIVTNRSFIQNSGSATLLGQLADYWSQISVTYTNIWIDWKFVADGTAIYLTHWALIVTGRRLCACQVQVPLFNPFIRRTITCYSHGNSHLGL